MWLTTQSLLGAAAADFAESSVIRRFSGRQPVHKSMLEAKRMHTITWGKDARGTA
ncbi:hypothetical protein LTR57_023713, partial [Friedmanniomyces endolithicus]